MDDIIESKYRDIVSIIYTQSLHYRTKVECAAMCLSENRCFSFRFDESSPKCRLMEKEGLCINRPTYTGPIYTDVYVDDSEPTTFPACK